MKRIRLLFCLVGLLFLSSVAQADVIFRNVSTYVGAYGNGLNTQVVFYLDVLTPEGVYHGEYYQDGNKLKEGNLPNRSWNGPGTAPSIYVHTGIAASDASCPGLSSLDSGWFCNSLPVDITVHGPTHGCPWMVTTRILSTTTSIFLPADQKQYLGPKANQTTCPTEPAAAYDISWSENAVVHNKVLSLKSTGAVIEQTLSTYLMRDSRLCDGSQYDERGAYCRFMSQLITFTSEGCDDSKVSITVTEHPITDRQLHDMLMRVDTTSRQPINATCRFQYILNEL